MLAQIGDRAAEVSREKGQDVAQTFVGLALGTLTPLDAYEADWLREGGVRGSFTERTKAEHRRAVKGLMAWLSQEGLGLAIESITRRVAGRFISEHLLPSGRHWRTIGKTISTLASYWHWLRMRGHAPDTDRSPWAGQSPPRAARPSGPDLQERAFADAELALLLASPPDGTLADFMLVAALTGMRREEIGLLRVADCDAGVFVVHRGKTAAARRRVPVHSGLIGLVTRRSVEKSGTAYLFHELSQNAERTDPIGKLFTRYRRSVGLQEGTGRRSLVNFHSFRRWFITRAVNAGQPPHIVSIVVGHRLKGMTLGTYYGGTDDAALRACVEAVQLPGA